MNLTWLVACAVVAPVDGAPGLDKPGTSEVVAWSVTPEVTVEEPVTTGSSSVTERAGNYLSIAGRL
jgi:hypothetical protein